MVRLFFTLKLALRSIWNQSRGKAALLSLLLFALIFATFLPALRSGFIDIDDGIFITRNPHLPLTLANVLWAVGHSYNANWLPVTLWSFMADNWLWGREPWGFHLTNLLLHAANCVLLFLVLRRMTGSVWRSLAVAGLFGLHPLRVESVAWISERKDVLSTLFWLLALWFYARFALSRAASQSTQSPATPGLRPTANRFAASDYALALLFFAFGLMSKPMVVTFPFVLLLLDFWPLARWPRNSLARVLVEKLPFLLLSAVVSAITYVAQKNASMLDPVFTGLSVTLGERAENALVSYGRYLGKLFWPVNLCVGYPYPDRWPVPVILLAGLLVVGITVFTFVLRRRAPYLLTGWLWYLGTLVPVLGLVSVGAQAMADRYSYIPSMGILVALVWGISQWTERWHYRGILLGVVGSALALLCIGLTRHQLGFWKDDVSVWRRAVSVTENNYAAHNLLGCALYSQGRFEEAIMEFQEAADLNPRFAEIYCSMGQSYAALGRLDDAIAAGQKALEVRPGFVAAHNNLSEFFLRLGRPAEAMKHCRLAAELEPQSVTVQNNLANALALDGQYAEALAHFQKALAIDPENSVVQANLGSALLRMGKPDEAIHFLRQSLVRQPDNAQTHNNLGGALLAQGRTSAAVDEFRRAVELEPGRFEARRNLGHAFLKQGNYDEAIQEFRKALSLQPNSTQASNDLSVALELQQTAQAPSTRSDHP